jgi:beta-glucosidase-like glycosyl hydrolase
MNHKAAPLFLTGAAVKKISSSQKTIRSIFMDRTKALEQAKALVAKMSVEEACEQLRYEAPKNERLGIPAYNWWNETLHGVARAGVSTVFPQAIGMAAAFDTEMMEEVADVCAVEGRAKYNEFSKRDDRDIYKTVYGAVYLGLSLTVLPLFLVYFLLSKYIIEGVALGGVKG